MEIISELKALKEKSTFRKLRPAVLRGNFINFDITKKENWLLNLGSNDYLGIASDDELKNEFLETFCRDGLYFGAGASRLIYSGGDDYELLESWFEEQFKGKKALIFSSGYSANFAFISCFGDKETLFLADKLVHASMIDALKSVSFKRFKHNDCADLERLLEQNRSNFKDIIVLCESLYSMDGDYAPLKEFKALCKKYGAKLYVDEAHSFFALSKLGECEKQGIKPDFMLVTLSKAVGGYGAVLLTDKYSKEYLINKARSFIYSTSLPPVNVAWAWFILGKDFSQRRKKLEKNVKTLALSNSQIAPFVVSSSQKAIELSKKLARLGYFIPALRPPTVKEPRLRISLRADLDSGDLAFLKRFLDEKQDY